MIPNFNQSNVLPPFVGNDYPNPQTGISPYRANLEELVERFMTSEERKNILIGFLNFRIEMKKVGIINGFQWIDGSFSENIEKRKKRAPKDIDVITFAQRPAEIKSDDDWKKFFNANQKIFNPRDTKELFSCDAYFVDLHLPQDYIVKTTSYWFGVFSHQRETYLWKGMLELSLSENEEKILEKIQNGGYNAS